MKQALIIFVGAAFCITQFAQAKTRGASRETQAKIYSFTMKTIDGKEKKLADYKGKVLLIVNVASKCGFTPQYKGLEALYNTYKDRGFAILAFPENNFHNQEPGTNAQIKQFCTEKYGVTFDMFSKINVIGKNQSPLYAYLTKDTPVRGEVQWNFQKYLVNRDGKVVAKFQPSTEPLDKSVTSKIEELLKEKS
jgi:glutathione peroxidase